MAAKKSKKMMKNKQDSSKKSKKHSTVNPFELKINRQKYNVLGRKLSKCDKGMPGVSRSKAIKKRLETIGVELKTFRKGNKIVDKRIGEHDPTMSLEEKMAKRFVHERKKEEKQLEAVVADSDDGEDSDIELTHCGKSLSEIDNFKSHDPELSDSDDEDSDEGRLSADFVGKHLFGGFLTNSGETTADGKPKTLAECIAQSKREKYEKKLAKEHCDEQVDDVDAEWPEIRKLQEAIRKANEETMEEEKKPKTSEDSYRLLINSFHFARQGVQATDRLKTEAEIAKEESEKLEKLEADRLRRMRGVTVEEEQQSKLAMRSADDLDDGFSFEPSSGPEEDNKQDSDEGSASEDEGSDAVSEAGDSDDDAIDSEADDGASDDDDDVEPDSESNDEFDGDNQLEPVTKKVRFADSDVIVTSEYPRASKPVTTEEIEKAAKELPYTFPAPKSYVELKELFAEHSDETCLVIIDRLRKCHHPSLAEGNKAKLEVILSLLLRYFVDVCRRGSLSPHFLDSLTVHLHEMTAKAPKIAGQTMVDIVYEEYQKFLTVTKQHNGKGRFPGLDVLLCLKLVGVLFPTSDLRHPVVTPAMLFLSHILTKCTVKTARDVSSGLFACSLLAEYVALSKRFVPEAVIFLTGVLFLARTKPIPAAAKFIVPPFNMSEQLACLLKLSDSITTSQKVVEPVRLSQVFIGTETEYLQSDEFKLQCMSQCLRLLNNFATLYSALPSFHQIFYGAHQCLAVLPLSAYPESIKGLCEKLSNTLSSKAPLKPLVRPADRPKDIANRYEPKFSDSFDGRKHRKVKDPKVRERQRLAHKVKDAQKSAKRELRRDNQAIAQLKLNQQLARDTERKRKVALIHSQLAQQEGEFKALKKRK